MAAYCFEFGLMLLPRQTCAGELLSHRFLHRVSQGVTQLRTSIGGLSKFERDNAGVASLSAEQVLARTPLS